MNSEKYIAAIEIGSSRISGALGRVHTDSLSLDVLAVETEHLSECVRHGMIQNVEEVSSRVMRIISRLERRMGGNPPRRIKAIYAGLAGRSLRNEKITLRRALPDDTEITSDILNSLRDEARSYPVDSNLEVVDAQPRAFMVDKTEIKNPVGTFGSNLSADYNLIVCRPILRKHIQRVIQEKAGLNLAAMVVTPTALADMVLTAEEKRLGCMLVDLGAETTTVAIYKADTLLYLAVLPMGSRNITTDITSLSLLEERAEEIKTTSGSAIQSENPSTLNLSGIKLSDVANLVAARSEEIVANIIQQITYAGITDNELPAGIVMAGAGFNLNRLPELLKNQSGLAVRRANLPNDVAMEDAKASTYEALQLVAILRAGLSPHAPECVEIQRLDDIPSTGGDTPDPLPEPDPEKPGKTSGSGGKIIGGLGRFGRKIAGIFAPSEDDDDDTELS